MGDPEAVRFEKISPTISYDAAIALVESLFNAKVGEYCLVYVPYYYAVARRGDAMRSLDALDLRLQSS